MRKIVLIIFCLCSVAGFGQFNYSNANAANTTGTYTDLGTNGTAVTTNFASAAMTFDDDNSSIQNIGFNFVYNGTTYTQFTANTNGFIKLGNTAVTGTDQYDITQSTIADIIAPFNIDLDEGTSPEIRVYTTGSVGSRVTTVQWEGFVDWNSTPANAQFTNVQFQLKLYEGSNNIEFVYGTFSPSAAASAAKWVAVGVKGSTMTNSVVVTKGSTQAYSAATFLNGGYGGTSATVNYHNVRNSVLPDAGRTYKFNAALANDGLVAEVYALGKFPMAYNPSQTVTASIKNIGQNAMTNVTVTLNVTGANTFTNTQNIASLAAGASTTVTFAAFTATNAGTNTITVSLPSDDNTANNSKSYTQVSTYKTLGYADNSAATTALGYNTGGGLLLAKYNLTGTGYVRTVSAFISSGATNTGNTVYAVVLDAAGAIIGQSANYIITAGDLGTWKTFTITTPPTVTNADFYVGLAQTANAVGYYPLGTQTEIPARANTFYTAALAGGATTATTAFGRFMIDAGIESTLPVTLVNFKGERKSATNLLSWTTSTESNNQGFELERSANGTSFTSIAKIASKAENGNSSNALNYAFTDARPFAGSNYYRLKQIDMDGKTTYSGVVLLKGNTTGLEISAAYPNPAKDRLNLVVSSGVSEKATITVTDISGKIVKMVNTGLSVGDNNIILDVASLAAGTYNITLTNNNEVITTRFIKN
jgi:hypothetical protein